MSEGGAYHHPQEGSEPGRVSPRPSEPDHQPEGDSVSGEVNEDLELGTSNISAEHAAPPDSISGLPAGVQSFAMGLAVVFGIIFVTKFTSAEVLHAPFSVGTLAISFAAGSYLLLT